MEGGKVATPIELLTAEEAADMLRLSSYTVRKLLREGEIKGVKVGKRQWRVKREELESYLNKHPGGGRTPAASAQRASGSRATALLSEPLLARDWLLPEEDEAWEDSQLPNAKGMGQTVEELPSVWDELDRLSKEVQARRGESVNAVDLVRETRS